MSPAAATPRFETLRVERIEEGTVLRILLDKPKGNVLDSKMMGEISAALEEHADDEALRLVLLRGAGGSFSYGASIEEHRKEQAPGMLGAFHRLVRRLAEYPVPVAALVEGQCLGGGFELVLICHFLFATPGARFGCPEIKLGVFPPVLAAVGTERLGSFPAERMLLTGDTVTAAEAERLGWLTGTLEGDDPEQDLLAWYRKTLAPLSAFALRQGTRALRRSAGWARNLGEILDRAEAQYVDEILESHDGNEGIEAFLERREPAWRNR
ncbi:MAG: enoyl-CoA hydratase/isomerase family protein [Acidobacteriota bacterium]|jgi:cyclohexa-1,5-dienecarbonyl-CoA hydratase